MRLDEYREKHNLSQEDFAKKLDPSVSQGLVSQWERGVTAISLATAVQIQSLTGSEVTVHDCADMYHDKSKAA